MRTTLTLDSDVAALIERIRRERETTLRDLVNEALRRGLRDMNKQPKTKKPFRTKVFEGHVLLMPVDNIAEALAIAEGEGFK